MVTIWQDTFDDGDFSDWDTPDFEVYGGGVTLNSSAHSARCTTGQTSTYQGRYQFDTARRITTLRFYYNQNVGCEGCGVRVEDSNGNWVCGVASDGSDWMIDDANGITEVRDTDTYHWIRVTITFFWADGTFDVEWYDRGNGTLQNYPDRPLKQSTDAAAVTAENFDIDNGGSGWRSGAIDCYFENFAVTQAAPDSDRYDFTSLDVVGNDQVDVTWGESHYADSYEITMKSHPDSSWTTPSTGPATPDYTVTSGTYTAASSADRNAKVGIDSAFEFRIAGVNAAGTAPHEYTHREWSDPVPPRRLSIARDGLDARLRWSVQSRVDGGTEIQRRTDTGSGFGPWTTVTTTGPGTEFVADRLPETDSRSQYRLRTVTPDGSRTSAWTYGVWGGQLTDPIFAADFESGDLSAWDAASVVEGTGSGLDVTTGGDQPSAAAGVTGADEGDHFLVVSGGESVTTQLGDLSGESDVLVEVSLATGGMEDATESSLVEWYDGSTWTPLVEHAWAYNAAGWVRVAATVPAADLATDNRLRITQPSGASSTDYTLVDDVRVSTQAAEHAPPTQIGAPSIDTSHKRELGLIWSDPNEFETDQIVEHKHDVATSWSRTPVGRDTQSHVIAGLDDGQKYAVRVTAQVNQYRRGSLQDEITTTGVGETAITDLRPPASLTASVQDGDDISVAWRNTNAGVSGHRVWLSHDGETYAEAARVGAHNTVATVTEDPLDTSAEGTRNGEEYYVSASTYTNYAEAFEDPDAASSTDDGDDTTLSYKASNADVNLVADYGADDTAGTPIDSALDSALADGHRIIYFPAGDYAVDELSTAVADRANVKLWGENATLHPVGPTWVDADYGSDDNMPDFPIETWVFDCNLEMDGFEWVYDQCEVPPTLELNSPSMTFRNMVFRGPWRTNKDFRQDHMDQVIIFFPSVDEDNYDASTDSPILFEDIYLLTELDHTANGNCSFMLVYDVPCGMTFRRCWIEKCPNTAVYTTDATEYRYMNSGEEFRFEDCHFLNNNHSGVRPGHLTTLSNCTVVRDERAPGLAEESTPATSDGSRVARGAWIQTKDTAAENRADPEHEYVTIEDCDIYFDSSGWEDSYDVHVRAPFELNPVAGELTVRDTKVYHRIDNVEPALDFRADDSRSEYYNTITDLTVDNVDVLVESGASTTNDATPISVDRGTADQNVTINAFSMNDFVVEAPGVNTTGDATEYYKVEPTSVGGAVQADPTPPMPTPPPAGETPDTQ